jgi:hypothetical protein
MPDFFIGAHVAVAGLPLLTRDAQRYRSNYPSVALITLRPPLVMPKAGRGILASVFHEATRNLDPGQNASYGTASKGMRIGHGHT